MTQRFFSSAFRYGGRVKAPVAGRLYNFGLIVLLLDSELMNPQRKKTICPGFCMVITGSKFVGEALKLG